MKSKPFFAVLFFSLLLISCNKGDNKSLKEDLVMPDLQSTQSPLKTNEKDKIPVGNQPLPVTDSVAKPDPLKPAPVIDWDKKIVKTATLNLEVKNFKAYTDNVHKTVKQYGGYIAQEDNNLTPEKSETVITIKVPVQQFEDLVNQLPAGDVKVLERKITSGDVTGQVVDTRSRLETKKQMRLKYLEFLKQSKNMEEVLQVQGEINGIQEEIEAAGSRVESLSHQSAYSTINLTYYEPRPGFTPIGDATPTFFGRVAAAFRSGASWIAELFVALISIWPLLLVIIGALFIFKRSRAVRVNQQ